MPVKPRIVTLTNSSVDILNAIRNSASTNYRDYVPVATNEPESIREIGATIMDYPALQNEFLNALVNRIGKVLITSKMYENPLAMFKQGMLEFGETIEEIFVEIAKAQQYDPDVAAHNVFKREIPDVRAAFHIMNYQKFYKATVNQDQLKQAFVSWEGITELIGKIVDSMYTGANYDEFLTMKYMLARRILNGQLFPVTIPTVNASNMKTIVSTIKGTSNDLTFMNEKFNLAHVHTHTKKEEQFVLMNSKFDASVDVEVLASAFNMDKAEFIGKRVLVDSFGSLDTARLNELFADDKTYTPITPAQLQALDTIPAVLVDKSYFMIFDNYYNLTENFNGEGIYWNYWYHTWKTFSVSPYANAVMFIPATPSVDSVVVSPSSASGQAGDTIQFKVDVTTSNFASKEVMWTVSDETKAKVNASGLVTLLDNAGVGDNIIVTATAMGGSLKQGTASVIVGTGSGGSLTATGTAQASDMITGATEIELTGTELKRGTTFFVTHSNGDVGLEFNVDNHNGLLILYTGGSNELAGVYTGACMSTGGEPVKVIITLT